MNKEPLTNAQIEGVLNTLTTLEMTMKFLIQNFNLPVEIQVIRKRDVNSEDMFYTEHSPDGVYGLFKSEEMRAALVNHQKDKNDKI